MLGPIPWYLEHALLLSVPACIEFGRCAVSHGTCIADCRASRACQQFNRCIASNDVCRFRH